MKQLFLDLIDAEIPDTVAGFAGTIIPELEEITAPATISDAIIAQGKLAANINLILKAFEGFAPVELILRNSSRNPLLKALVVASYQMFRELEINRLSELKASLQDISSRLDSIAASGEVSQDDLRAFTLGTQGLSGVVGSLNEEQQGLIASAVNAITDFASEAAGASAEEIKTLAAAAWQLVNNAIEALK